MIALALRALILVAALWPVVAGAQDPPAPDPAPSFDGAPIPVPPAVDSREGGKVTLRAVRLARPLQIDGRLDELTYQEVALYGVAERGIAAHDVPVPTTDAEAGDGLVGLQVGDDRLHCTFRDPDAVGDLTDRRVRIP